MSPKAEFTKDFFVERVVTSVSRVLRSSRWARSVSVVDEWVYSSTTDYSSVRVGKNKEVGGERRFEPRSTERRRGRKSDQRRLNYNGSRVGCLRDCARGGRQLPSALSVRSVCARSGSRRFQIRSFFDVQNDPIVKEVLKEPVAFLGGVFAGLLRLDLNEDPLREWVAKTAEAAGIEPEEESESASSEDVPSEIEIE